MDLSEIELIEVVEESRACTPFKPKTLGIYRLSIIPAGKFTADFEEDTIYSINVPKNAITINILNYNVYLPNIR